MSTAELKAPALPPTVSDVVDGLAALPAVRSVRIAGSRARGKPTRPDSDWDILAYTDTLPASGELRRLLPPGAGSGDRFELHTANAGHPFQESEFTVPVSPRIDVCLRPLVHLRQEEGRAARGTFTVHSYPKTAGGVPSYILLSEAALSAPVHGDVGAPACPDALVTAAGPWWRGRASCALLLAIDHVAAGEPLGALEHVLAAATSVAHSRLISRGRWYPITKRLLDEAGVIDPRARERLAGLSAGRLTEAVVRQVADDLEVDVDDGLDWLARGEHMGPGRQGQDLARIGNC
ncbi:nucleotidyltransferase domain-containing protein [Streptomyces sp. NPDC047049]|uniref:nucleotidyltransferase domain-containing protein n=1 Tax=Streptomyces sp. NPDC047049 TaxID=3156688 RepID=UPI0033D4B987